ncbi:MAG: hypothetical protein RBT63_02235 [Bdellovibrionales bacterium]|jgi:hypothetical protein|nr:hypothetical protein [Bdellovibrionales bacterium]
MAMRILMPLVSGLIFSTTFFSGFTSGGNVALANELDNETLVANEQALRAKDLPATVVVRVNDTTGETSVLELQSELSPNQASITQIASLAGDFKTITAQGELDHDSSTASWYVWFNFGRFYAPTYHYWGYRYHYTNYYTYTWYGYSYRWYRWRWW